MTDKEKTAAELAAEERAAAIARGDIIEGDEDDETVDGSSEELDESEESADTEESDSEDDEESTEETEDSDGEGGDEEEEEPEKGIMIPKARFDEAQKKARDRQKDLEDRLAKAETQHARTTSGADIDAMQTAIEALEDQYEEQLLDGELEKARAIRHDIRKKQNTLTDTRLTQQSQATGNLAVQQIRYEAKLAALEAKHPAINPDSDAYSEEIEQEVGELKAAFEARGWNSVAALEKAVHYALRDDVDVGVEDPQVKRSQRAHQQRKKNAAAQKKAAPDMSGAGRDSDKGGRGDGLPDVTKMTPEQFDKLSESDLSKLRGDVLGTEAA